MTALDLLKARFRFLSVGQSTYVAHIRSLRERCRRPAITQSTCGQSLTNRGYLMMQVHTKKFHICRVSIHTDYID